MNITIATVFFGAIIFAVMQGWMVLAGFLIVLFSVRYSTLPLVFLAIALDGYYGNFFVIPYLSLASVVWYVLMEYIRPKLHSPDMIKI